jgi:hypothetical protein
VAPIDYGRAAALTDALEDRLVAALGGDEGVSRRAVLGGIGFAGSGTAAAGGDERAHGHFGARGEYGDGFDPHAFLRQFNTGFDGQEGLDQRVTGESFTCEWQARPASTCTTATRSR